MAGVSLDSLTKRFGDTAAVDGVSLRVAPGEFVALLGASGCGKTTLLRLIAGFEHPDDGTIAIDGETVAGPRTSVPPERRRLGMVFQSYALWPHLSVAENVGYPLKVRRVARAERASRVARALDLVGLTGFADRRPAALSGGQRQRVALARCLAAEPSVVLLDEPLANLDIHLRESLQVEFRRFHAAAGATFVYVTPDQAEAMALADRVAVMVDGRIAQVAPPRALYDEPADETVARFVGRGQVVSVAIEGGDGAGRVAARLWDRPVSLRGAAGPGRAGRAVLRAERLRLAGAEEAGRAVPARVDQLIFHGPVTTVHARVEADETTILQVPTSGPPPAVGDRVAVAVDDGWVLPG